MCVVLGLLFSSAELYGKRSKCGDGREDGDMAGTEKRLQLVFSPLQLMCVVKWWGTLTTALEYMSIS